MQFNIITALIITIATGAIAAPYEAEDRQVLKRQTWLCNDTLAAQCKSHGLGCDCGVDGNNKKVVCIQSKTDLLKFCTPSSLSTVPMRLGPQHAYDVPTFQHQLTHGGSRPNA
ncbi:uncharacterized protein RAG0_07461 [Rhynchosporium agropyri]|uniref:Extracellular membrane protein CFEM domain-containing protein n=1 Tax=Rhynchosporium agropyri TaxID=914238 RepID=A0A1E1KLI3_9HELO|nr:uncharacterized protein RAG0_07461 [Rhynchosporium agropyri]